jgi:hypothetical protein
MMGTPRWLGWVLLTAGAFGAILWTFVIVVAALSRMNPGAI